MSKIVTTIAVLMLACAGTAAAQDHRFPDPKPVAVTQDLRSPDARSLPVQPAAQDLRSPDAQPGGRFQPAAQDLRSPDAQPGGRFQPAPPVAVAHSSNTFEWGYLAIAITVALLILGTFALTQRRRRHGLAIGS